VSVADGGILETGQGIRGLGYRAGDWVLRAQPSRSHRAAVPNLVVGRYDEAADPRFNVFGLKDYAYAVK